MERVGCVVRGPTLQFVLKGLSDYATQLRHDKGAFLEVTSLLVTRYFPSFMEPVAASRLRLKCDCARANIRFRLSAKRTSPFKSAGASFQSTTGSRGVRISGSNAGYTMFRGSVKGTGYPLHSPVSPSLPLPCVTVWHHVSTGLYHVVHFVSDVWIVRTRTVWMKYSYNESQWDALFLKFIW